jgi:hypothetical protein
LDPSFADTSYQDIHALPYLHDYVDSSMAAVDDACHYPSD